MDEVVGDDMDKIAFVRKCPICGEPYNVYSYYAADQSACPDCRGEADNKRKGEPNEPQTN